jgi:predicted aspartyl protease
MPIRNYPFSVIRPGDIARPYLPVTIVNPNTQKQINAYSLIDTGADECAFPASFAPLLGHNLQAGQLKRISTGNGVTIAYSHTTRIIIEGFFNSRCFSRFHAKSQCPITGSEKFS